MINFLVSYSFKVFLMGIGIITLVSFVGGLLCFAIDEGYCYLEERIVRKVIERIIKENAP